MKKDLQELIKEFMYECEFGRKLRSETLRGYRSTFDIFMKLKPGITIELFSASVMTDFFQILQTRKRGVGSKGLIIKTGVKKSTIATHWTRLNNFCEWARIKGYIKENPFSTLTYPSPTYESREFIKKEDIEKIISAVHNNSGKSLLRLKRNLVIFHILLFCGLRRGELFLLQIRDIDIERKLLTVRAENSKIPRTRYVPIHSQLILYLKDYLNERKHFTTQYLIVSSTSDKGLSKDGLIHLVKKIVKVSGVRFHMHQFRHTFSINQLNQTTDISMLKQLLGHTDIRMTARYLTDIPTSAMRGNIENMRIDNLL